MKSDVEIRFDFFPEPVRAALVRDIDHSRERKRQFPLGAGAVPSSLSEAAAFASTQLDLRFNVAISKWYRLSDEYESQAYEAHRDPPNLTSIPLVLCTLKGAADLVFWSETADESLVRCVENMLVLLKPTLTHRISPPLAPGGERYFLFLGFDTALQSTPKQSKPLIPRRQ